MKKKIFVILLLLSVLICGCSKDKNDKVDNTNNDVKEEKKVQIIDLESKERANTCYERLG